MSEKLQILVALELYHQKRCPQKHWILYAGNFDRWHCSSCQMLVLKDSYNQKAVYHIESKYVQLVSWIKYMQVRIIILVHIDASCILGKINFTIKFVKLMFHKSCSFHNYQREKIKSKSKHNVKKISFKFAIFKNKFLSA